jgi:hypothetical protein
MNTVLFKESQRFRQLWLWLILLLVNASVIYGCVRQLFLGKPFGNNPISDTGAVLVVAFSLLVTVFVLSFRLDTLIDEEGLHVRYFPILPKYRHYPWADISQCYVRKYNPILEYGGWGIRFGFKNGRAYNTSGNKGIQLVFTNGKKLLIGTGKEEEVHRVLMQSGHLKPAP